MSTSSAELLDGLTEKGETRVMGLGVGVFLIFFFSIVSIVICLVGATTPQPCAFACGATGLLAFVCFILLVAERDSRYVEDKSDQVQEYDQTFYPRLVLVLIMAVAAVIGFVGVCLTHLAKPLYATPMYDRGPPARKPIF